MFRSFALCLVLLAAFVASAQADAKTTRFELENGLDVAIRPVAGTQDVCVLVLFDVGEDHDPEGMSGLGHLVEHLYVTSAAGEVPARTAEQMMVAYPMRWNAQTGARYTVIAFVEPAENLASAVLEAAARMGALEITDEGIEREKGRMLEEVGNMYGRMPMLGAQNLARALVRPSPNGGQKGGLPAQIKTLDPEVVRARHRDFYKPGNARLVIAGAVDPESARGLVESAFSGLPRGKALPEIAVPEPADKRLEVREDSTILPGNLGAVALGLRTPPPGDESYGAFLFLASRLFKAVNEARLQKKAPPFTPLLAPLDEPDVMLLAQALTNEGGPEYHADLLRREIHDYLVRDPTPAERVQANQTFGFLLGTYPIPDAQLAGNLYGLAFRIGRSDQLGLEPLTVAKQILAVDTAALEKLGKEWFAPTDGAVGAVVPRDG